MTKPIPMYTQDKSRNFGHAIVGYYSDGHKWVPVTVNQDGHLLFKQDPDTAAAITAFAASIEALVEYVHDAKEEFGEVITLSTQGLDDASTYVRTVADSMLTAQETFLTTAHNNLQSDFAAFSAETQTALVNTVNNSMNPVLHDLDILCNDCKDTLINFNGTLEQFDSKVSSFNSTVDEFYEAVARLDEALDDFISMTEEEISEVVDTAFSPLSDSEINEIAQLGWE